MAPSRKAPGLSRRSAALVALAYLLIALWAMRGVLPAPTEILLGVPAERRLSEWGNADLRMVVGVVAGHAGRLTSRPRALREEGQCHPMPRSYTLGEHMFGEGLLAALPMALGRDPILAYNALLVLTLWIPALAMFALTWSFTRSVPAAFIAGLAFAFARVRLADPAHPYVHGDLWTPLAILFLYRLFTRESWGSALGLALFGALTLTESLYPILATALLLATCGAFLFVKYHTRVFPLLPKLAFCAAVAALMAWLVLAPYLDTARTWGLATGRWSMFASPDQFTPGHELFPGAVLVLLAALGLVDRLRGSRRGPYGDPRAAMAVAALLALWCSLWPISIPGTSVDLPSPLLVARGIVPGLDSARALYAIRIGVNLALCVLAAYGALAVLERLSARIAAPITAVIALAILAEVFHPSSARWSFGAPLPVEPLRLALPDDDIALLRSLDQGAVLDIPSHLGSTVARAHYLLASGYHGQPTSACYNSYPSPVAKDVAHLAETLADPQAAEALAALGFRTVIVHLDQLPDPYREPFFARLAESENAGGLLARVGETPDHVIYRLRGRGPIGRSVDQLVPAPSSGEPTRITLPKATLAFEMANRGEATYLHPDPIAPTPALVRWKDSSGAVVAEAETKALLPLALAAGQVSKREIPLDVPVPPGRYTVTLALPADPERVLAEQMVEVEPPAGDAEDAAGAPHAS